MIVKFLRNRIKSKLLSSITRDDMCTGILNAMNYDLEDYYYANTDLIRYTVRDAKSIMEKLGMTKDDLSEHGKVALENLESYLETVPLIPTPANLPQSNHLTIGNDSGCLTENDVIRIHLYNIMNEPSFIIRSVERIPSVEDFVERIKVNAETDDAYKNAIKFSIIHDKVTDEDEISVGLDYLNLIINRMILRSMQISCFISLMVTILYWVFTDFTVFSWNGFTGAVIFLTLSVVLTYIVIRNCRIKISKFGSAYIDHPLIDAKESRRSSVEIRTSMLIPMLPNHEYCRFTNFKRELDNIHLVKDDIVKFIQTNGVIEKLGGISTDIRSQLYWSMGDAPYSNMYQKLKYTQESELFVDSERARTFLKHITSVQKDN